MRYYILSKETIEEEIVPLLPLNKRGFATRVELCELVNAILYKLHSGMQWRNLPVEWLFGEQVISWNTVYYHFRKWAKGSVIEQVWLQILRKYRHKIDLSLCNLDGSHTAAIRGGDAVGYQHRKKANTTNALYLSDRQGIPLVMSEPVSGNHNDVYKIKKKLNHMVNNLQDQKLCFDGVFMNADAGFDAEVFRQVTDMQGIITNVKKNPRNGNSDQFKGYVFDNEAYKNRFVVERSFAWLDKFRSVLNRFDFTSTSWKSMNYLGMIVIGLDKFHYLKV